MTPDMNADILRLAQFVNSLPLAKWNPSALQIASNDRQVRSWGVAGKDGGLFWVQDFSMENKTIDEVRKATTVRKGVKVVIQGLAGGTYTITPYDTWQGISLKAFDVTCTDGQVCTFTLPDFKADMAFKLEVK